MPSIKLMASPQPLSYSGHPGHRLLSRIPPPTPACWRPSKPRLAPKSMDLLRTLPAAWPNPCPRRWPGSGKTRFIFLSGNGQEVDEQALSLACTPGSMEPAFAYRTAAGDRTRHDSSLIVWPLAQSFLGNVRMDGLKNPGPAESSKVLDWMRQYKRRTSSSIRSANAFT